MAIRKVSDLEKLEVDEIFGTTLSTQLNDMFFEVSYPTEVKGKTYKSMKVTHDELATITIARILCAEGDTIFYYPTVFSSSVSALCDFYISGNFYVNRDFPDSFLRNKYETFLKNGKTTIYSVTSNLLSALEENIFSSPINTICSDTQILATFTDDQTILRSDRGPLNLDFSTINIGIDDDHEINLHGDLTVYDDSRFIGTATFEKDIIGCALCAKWADLAEMYEADYPYEPGTLVKFGGEKEITIADKVANAVVTTQPGLVLGNQNDKNHIGIALVGRVPVKCQSPISKFDQLVLSEIPGIARKKTESDKASSVIGISLEDNSSNKTETLVECAVRLNI